MNNYIILIDENGQPYISHSLWGRLKSGAKSDGAKVSKAKTSGSRVHKYIEKIGEGAKARYFYTQEELKAFYGRGKAAAASAADKARSAAKSGREALKTAGDKARDAIGITAKREMDSAYDEFGKAARRWSEARDSAEATTSKAEKAKEALDAFKAERRPFIMPTRKAQELHEQAKELEAAYERASRDAGHEQLRLAMAEVVSDDALNRYFSAMDKYTQTPLGALDLDYADSAASIAVDKVEEFGSSLRDKATKAADKVKGTAASLKGKASEAIDEAKDKVTKAADKVKGTVASLKDKASDAVDEVDEQQSNATDGSKSRKQRDSGYDSAFYKSPSPSLDILPDGRHAKVTRILQTEGLAEDAVANAGRSLSKANTIDDARRSASEKRMAEKELSGSRGSFDRWRESESSQSSQDSEPQKEITASQARKLQEKLASGKELSQSELNQLMSFLMKGYE